MSALALSVLLSFVSALAYAGGAIVQEQVAVSSPDSGYLPLRRPGWWGALALNGLGGVLHVVALAYGPLSLVQPLGALTIVFALPMAALCVGRRAGATAWRGALMATVGLAGLLSLVGSSSAHSLAPAQRLAVALVTGGAVVALMFAGLAAHRHPAVRSVLLATASGIAFGMSSVFTKTVAVDWSHGIALGDLPSLAVIGLFAVAGVLLSQASYRGGGLAAPLATLTVVNPVLAAAVGILMFGETFRYGTTGTVLALGCGVVAAGGLIMLTTERLTRETAPAPATPSDPPESVSTAPSDGRALVSIAPSDESAPVPTAPSHEPEPVSTAASGESASAVPAPDVLSPAAVTSGQRGVTVAAEPARSTEHARLAVPQPREGVATGAERGRRGVTGVGTSDPVNRAGAGEPAFPAGPSGPVRVPGAAVPAPVRAESSEPAGRPGPAEAVERAGASEAGVLAGATEPVTHAGAAEPVGHPEPARRVVRTGPAEAKVHAGASEAGATEPGVPARLVSGPAGSGGADTDDAGPPAAGVLPASYTPVPADGVLPVSYTPLPAGVAVPLPVPALRRTRVRS